MAFFKLRKAAGETQAPASAPAPESVDALRRRARYRLAGAAMLVLAGVVGFPLLFDNQPRPIAVDIPIDIPDKAKVAPLASSPVTPAASASATTAVAGVQAVAPQAAAEPVVTPPAVATPAPKEAPKETAKAESKPAAKETAKAEPKEEIISSSSKAATTPAPAKKDEKLAAKSEAKADKDTKKDSKSDSKSPDATGRFIVQFGAFTDSARAHEARVKVEKAGMKTYAQVIDGPEGKKFRVRVGPFEKRSDAEKAAEKIKKLDLPASVLGL